MALINTGPVGRVQALADAFHFLLLCALMLAEITQQKISPGGISEGRPPTLLAQQAGVDRAGARFASFLRAVIHSAGNS